jgi:hypothetical protein
MIDEAKALCATCTVRTECLDFAVASNQDFGVWGGQDEFERRTARQAHPAGHPTIPKIEVDGGSAPHSGPASRPSEPLLLRQVSAGQRSVTVARSQVLNWATAARISADCSRSAT